MASMKKHNKRKSPLYIGKEVHLQKVTIDEAFQKALEPYFTDETQPTKTKKIS